MRFIAAFYVLSILAHPGDLYAFPYFKDLFQKKYRVEERINSCVLCHGRAKGSTLNPFGRDFQKAGASEKAFEEIEKLDSDQDVVSNILEIKTYHYPGDPNDKPTRKEKKAYDSKQKIFPDLERELLETLQCPCDCDKTVDNCECRLAPKIKDLVREQIRKKKSKEQIKAMLVKKYGTRVLPIRDQTKVLPYTTIKKNKRTREAYKIAGEIPKIISSVPCYCFCYGKVHRHENLLDCFKNRHGMRCKICVDEVFIVRKLHEKGTPVPEIRAAIWEKFHIKR